MTDPEFPSDIDLAKKASRAVTVSGHRYSHCLPVWIKDCPAGGFARYWFVEYWGEVFTDFQGGVQSRNGNNGPGGLYA